MDKNIGYLAKRNIMLQNENSTVTYNLNLCMNAMQGFIDECDKGEVNSNDICIKFKGILNIIKGE